MRTVQFQGRHFVPSSGLLSLLLPVPSEVVFFDLGPPSFKEDVREALLPPIFRLVM